MAVLNISGSSQALVAAPSATRPLVYHGFSLRETSKTADAIVRIFDNAASAAGPILDEISLTAGQSAREIYPSDPTAYRILAVEGIYVQIVSGAVTGSVRYE